MRKTNIHEKIYASIINVIIVFVIFLPFYFLISNLLFKKFIFISLFFIYSFIFAVYYNGRDFGMMIAKTHWKEKYPLKNHIIYSALYTLSFSTLFFWIIFPFDLFLLNMLIIQLPCILITKTTFHGYLSGKMTTIKR